MRTSPRRSYARIDFVHQVLPTLDTVSAMLEYKCINKGLKIGGVDVDTFTYQAVIQRSIIDSVRCEIATMQIAKCPHHR